MEIETYKELAMRTVNPNLDKKELLINSVMGLCGESGEAIELVKKQLFHQHPLDKTGLIKELGDVAWYLAEAAWALDVSLEEILIQNIEKLKKRYPERFQKELSIHRNED